MKVRKTVGQSLIEVTALLAVAMPVLLLLLDGGIYLSAMYINDCACREAVRAVAAGCPAAMIKDAPRKNAAAALDAFGVEHGFIRIKKDCVISESVARPLPTEPFGGAVDGTATVITTAQVRLPLWCNLVRRNS